MAKFTIVTNVRQGDFNIVGILDGAYDLLPQEETEEVGEMGVTIIEAANREEANQIIRERYYPAQTTIDPNIETPC